MPRRHDSKRHERHLVAFAGALQFEARREDSTLVAQDQARQAALFEVSHHMPGVHETPSRGFLAGSWLTTTVRDSIAPLLEVASHGESGIKSSPHHPTISGCVLELLVARQSQCNERLDVQV